MLTSRPATEPKKRRRRVKVVDEIIESLRQDIVTRRLADGSRLPSEKELSERFGVSQPTAREAIRALETLGLVDVFHGSGSYVRSQGDYALASALQTLLQLENVEFSEVFNVRRVLGRCSVQAAAANALPEDIAAIAQACARFDEIERIKDVDGILEIVIGFQRAVSAASHSPLLHALEVILLGLLNEVQVKSHRGRELGFWSDRAMAFQDHRVDILKGIRSGDKEIAGRAMDRYFEAQRTRFDQDRDLQSLSLANPELIEIVANMVQQIKA